MASDFATDGSIFSEQSMTVNQLSKIIRFTLRPQGLGL